MKTNTNLHRIIATVVLAAFNLVSGWSVDWAYIDWDEDTKTISMSCGTEGATIYYTVDGTTPTTSSYKYTAPFVVNRNLAIRSIAVKGDEVSSVQSRNVSVDSRVQVGTIFYRRVDNTFDNVVEVCSPLTGRYEGEIDIPATIKLANVTYQVIRIGNSAFYDNNYITKVTIPNSIVSIGNYAFYSCDKLTSMTLPASVERIEHDAFKECYSLQSVSFNEGLETIEYYAFLNCSRLQNVTLPSTLKSIGYCAFEGCRALTVMVLPDGLTDIGYGLFYGCSNLASVKLPATMTAIPRLMFYSSGIKSITIPSTVKSIGESAFKDCDVLTSIVIPDGVESLGNSVFFGCDNLLSATIGEGVTTIPESAFNDDPALSVVSLPSTLVTIGESAFNTCRSLASITIPENVTSIERYAFTECDKLTSVYSLPSVPPSMGSGNDNPFYDAVARATLYVKSSALSAYQSSEAWDVFQTKNTIDQQACGQPTFQLADYILSMSTATAGATIYYTTDGTEPTTASTQYTAPIPFMQNGTVKAIAVKEGMANSAVSEFVKNNYQVPSPVATMDENFVVTLSCETPDITGFPETQIYYAINTNYSNYTREQAPDWDWKLWEGQPIQLTTPNYVHTYAEREGWNISENNVYDFYYDYQTSTPYMEWVSDKQKVRIYNYDADATVYYTLDGSDPTQESAVYNPEDSIFIDHNLTVKCIAIRDGHFNSEIASIEISSVTATFVIGDFSYRRIDGNPAMEVEVTQNPNSSKKYSGSVVVPSVITYAGNDYTVTRIGNSAFYDCQDLTSVTLPSTVTSIGEHAFYNVNNIKKIEFTGSSISIDFGAFESCDQLKDVIFHGELTKLDPRAFRYCSSLESITLPGGFTRIEGSSFAACTNLKQISIPEGVTYIGEQTFESCSSLTTIQLPSSLQKIDNWAFRSSALQSIVIPDNVTFIGSEVFSDCRSLTTVTLPAKLETLGTYTFYNCSALRSISIPEGLAILEYRTFSGCSALTTVLLPSTLTTIRERAFESCSALRTITLLESVKAIEMDAFIGCSALESVYVLPTTPPTVNGSFAFADQIGTATLYVKASAVDAYKSDANWCQFNTILPFDNIPTPQPTFAFDATTYTLSIVSQNPNAAIYYTRDNSEPTEQSTRYTEPIAFMQNDTVKAIAISEGLAPSLVSEFRKNDFKVPTPTAEINDETFVVTVSCETSEIEGFPETKFYYCLNDNYYNIDYNDEAWQLLEGNTIELSEPRYLHLYAVRDGWIRSEQTTFDYYSNYFLYQPQINYNSSNHTVTLTHYNDVASDFYYTLDGSEPSKENGTLYTEPFVVDRNYIVKAVAVMDKHFNSTVNSYEISGVSTTFLADGIYYRLKDMTTNNEVEVTSVPEGIANYSGNITIPSSVTYNNKVYAVTGIYNSAFNGSKITSITLPDGLQIIRGHAFYNCQSLTEIEIPSTVEEIGSNAFYGCYGLNKMTLPEGLKTLREYAFAYCTQLTNVTLPNTVTVIEHNTFYGCSGLTAITWPASVNTIEDNMFDGCEKLTNVTLPATLTSIKHAAFYNCRSLLKITLPESLTTIGYEAFRGCRALTSIVIPNGVKTIESSTFSNCQSLVSVLLPAQLETIGSEAFYNCPNLASITLPATLKTIGSSAFGTCESLNSIYAQPTNPPTAEGGAGFDESFYERATLFVQPASKNAYLQAPYWSQFKKISDFTQIAAEQPAFVFQDYKLTLSTITAGGVIYYTRDGSEPTTQSLRYIEPLIFTQNDTVKAITVAEGMANSLVAEFRKNDFRVAQPQSTLDESTFQMTITCEAPEAEGMPETRIWYAVRDSYYTPADNEYKLYDGEPIQLTEPSYVHVYAERDGWISSDKRYDNFYDNYRLDAPNLSWDTEQKMMTITQSAAEAIYYTLDGTEPSKENGTLYTEPFTLSRNLTVKAVAVKEKYFNSKVNSFIVTGLNATFMVDGIAYKLVDNTLENVVEVTSGSDITDIISIPESVTNNDVTYTVVRIGDNAFSVRRNSPYTRKYLLPKTIKSIGQSAFYDNYHMQEIVLNEGLETIGDNAFAFAFALEEISIPSTVVSIGNSAFCSDRDKTINIYCYAKAPQIEESTFGGRTEVATLNVYASQLSEFQTAKYWKDFMSIKTFELPIVYRPDFAFNANTYKLAISTPTEGATIYYTRDNTDPTTNSLVYTDSLIFTQNDTVRAMAVKNGMSNSVITEFKKNDFKVAQPMATIDTETFQVTINCETPDVEGMPETRIWYVIDQSSYNRSDGFTLYDGEPIQMTEPGYIHMYAERDGWIMSDQRYDNFYSDYRLDQPSISWDPEDKKFSITHNDSEVSCYYTLDGSEPTKENGQLYTEPVKLVRNLVVKAIAVKTGHFNSKVREYTVTDVDSRFMYDGLAYRLVDNTIEDVVEVTSGGNVSGKVTIPEKVNDTAGKPYTVVGIGNGSFSGENDITEVVLPETIRSIGDNAFSSCSKLTDINLPEALTEIGSEAFYGANLSSIVVPGGVKKLSFRAFMGSNYAKSVIIKEGVEEIGEAAFAYVGMQNLELPSTLTKIGHSAFNGCSRLVSVTIPNGMTEIDSYTFQNCNALATVSLSSSLTRIGYSAFSGCSSLAMIIFPETLKKIEDNAFASCVSLNHVYSLAANPPTIEEGSSPFTDVVEHATLYVKPQSENIYSQTPNWGAFSKIETFENLPSEKPVFVYEDHHLTMSSETEGVNIYYTTDGTEPTTSSLLYKEPVAIAKNGTIKAMAISDEWGRSLTSEWKKNDLQVANPIASISEDFTVTVTCEEPDVEGLPQTRIYYSLNRSSWNGGADEDWKLYTEPLKLTVANYLHVRAEREGWIKSGQSDFDYYSDYYLEKPSIDPYYTDVYYMPKDSTITISHNDAEAELYYTLDGSDPNENGVLYTAPFNPGHNVKVTAIAKRAGHINSDPESREYKWFTIATPKVSVEHLAAVITTERPAKTTIHYTLDNTEPTEESPVYTEPIALENDCVIRAMAVAENWNNSSTARYSFSKSSYTVATPRFSPVSGGTVTENADSTVLITSTTADATIYYTLDGSDPTDKSLKYEGAIKLEKNCKVRAIAVKEDMYSSDLAEATVNWFQVKQPRITFDGKYVSIETETSKTAVYYTLDNSTPDSKSKVYVEPFALPAEQTVVKAVAMRENWNNSSVMERTYNPGLNYCEMPAIARISGTDKVQMTTRTQDAVIYYTTDGSMPTTSSQVYPGEPITMTHNTTLIAMTTQEKLYDSETSTFKVDWFKMDQPVIAADGIYVSITSSMENARIYYTLDDSEPTTASTLYTGPLTMHETCTIKAIATSAAGDFNPSSMAVFNYYSSNYTCGKPTFSREGNAVSIASAPAEGTTIYYTLDGTEPTTASNIYTEPIAVNYNVTIKAMAVNPKLFSSTDEYQVNWFKVETPVLSLNGSTLTISTATDGAVIYYDFDEQPTANSPVYSSPITIVDNRKVFAVAVKNNWNDSEVATLSPDVFVCTQPTFSYNGRYLQVETGEGMTIHYTVDGTKPTASSDVCNGQIEITELCTVRAIATRKDFRDSPEKSYAVTYVYTGEDASQSEAGHLADMFQWIGGADNVVKLPVSGKVNADDLAFIRSLKSLRHLDMTNAVYEGNSLPDEAFAGMPLISFQSPQQLSSAGDHLFKDCDQLAAVVWNANLTIPETVIEDIKHNPNFLLYVNSRIYAPSSYKGNLISGGQANSITLQDTENGENFCCPVRFYTQQISYTHSYNQETREGETCGWETISLPFDVKTITHERCGALAPFAKEADMMQYKPFWLYELKETGFSRAADIKAYTPYIISMPNNPNYADDYILSGNVTFTATETYVEADMSRAAMKGSLSFAPAMQRQPQSENILAINLTDYTDGDGIFYESGSAFLPNMRMVRPFEAFALTGGAGANLLKLDDYLWGEVTDMVRIEMDQLLDISKNRHIYDLSGRRVSDSSLLNRAKQSHQRIYIINGKKTVVK